jgi:2-aminoadipate transaminase
MGLTRGGPPVAETLLARRAARLPAALPPTPPDTTISFESGHAFPDLLPDLMSAAERALSRFRAETLQYGPRMGLPGLRTWIAEYSAQDGVPISRDNVLVTNGAKQAIELVCRLLLDEGDSIVVTAPTYFTAIPIFKSFGVTFIEIGQDLEGMDVRQLADQLAQLKREGKPLPKFIYDVPDFHNPTGITMSHARRKALVELATREKIFLVEDSPYRRIRFDGEHVASLKSLDKNNLVFQIGTFSKLMAPGLRIGWVSTSPEMIARLTQLKADSGSCPLTQRIILEFCTAGQLDAHTARVQKIYRAHRDKMIECLRDELPEVSVDVPSGGYYLWLALPSDTDGDELAKRASAAGVSVLAPTRCYARSDAGHPKNHVRAAFTHATPEEIEEGVRRIATAFRSMPSASPVVAAR